MEHFFGKKPSNGPKKTETNIASKQTEYSLGKRTGELEAKCDQLETKLKMLETDIKGYYEKMKRTNLTSEKNYLKGRLKNLLMKRKQIEHQMSRYNGQRMMMDKVQFNQENVQDTLDMATHMKQINEVQKKQIDNMDMDAIQDTFEEMEELAWENDRIADMMNQNYEVDMDEDLDDELENLENELAVQDMMNNNSVNEQTQGYDPLKN